MKERKEGKQEEEEEGEGEGSGGGGGEERGRECMRGTQERMEGKRQLTSFDLQCAGVVLNVT